MILARSLPHWLPLQVALLSCACAASAVTVDWVTVGDPGNACDPQPDGCFGSVAQPYRISRFEVTNAQYVEFLNSVAKTDSNALYNSSMGLGFVTITRSGSPGNYSYGTIAGRTELPVVFVSFWDALRFANWLHNGQPVGLQDNTTTEDGAYTITATGIANNTVARNAGAEALIPSQDEWYKAAYYAEVSNSYFAYPAGTSTLTACATPGGAANTANCGNVVNIQTEVGSYTGAASPSGTFDQGGNVWEWNETIIGSFRGQPGGSYLESPTLLAASLLEHPGAPGTEANRVGFRVALPAPQTPLVPLVPFLSPPAIAVLLGLLALAGALPISRQTASRPYYHTML